MQSAVTALMLRRKCQRVTTRRITAEIKGYLAAHREELPQSGKRLFRCSFPPSRGLELDQSVAFLRYFAGWAVPNLRKRFECLPCHQWV